jgi:hypothetical protein
MLVPLHCLYQCWYLKSWLLELDGQDFFSLKRQSFVRRGDSVCSNDHEWRGSQSGGGNLDKALDAEAIKKPAVERRALVCVEAVA